MRQMENASCRRGAANAIKSLSAHHPEEVMEHLLHQPLPPDRGTEECWRELGSDDEFGLHVSKKKSTFRTIHSQKLPDKKMFFPDYA